MSTSPAYAALTNYDKEKIDRAIRFYIDHKLIKISSRKAGPYRLKHGIDGTWLITRIQYRYAV